MFQARGRAVEVTYRSNSAAGRDCTYCPAGLSECVSEHLDRSLCIKEKIENQLRVQLMERRLWFGLVVMIPFHSVLRTEIRRGKYGEC